MLKSGKHIDAFFDDLIKEILKLHSSVKEQYRLAQEEGKDNTSPKTSATEAQSPYRFTRSSPLSLSHKNSQQQKLGGSVLSSAGSLNDDIQQKYQKHCKKQEVKFKCDFREIGAFIKDGRLAEAYTNREYYECQLREMDKLRQNLTIYDNLLENQVSGLGMQKKAALEGEEIDESEAQVEGNEDGMSNFDHLKTGVVR